MVWETAIIYFKAMGLAAFLMWVPAFAAFVVESRYFKEEKGFLGFRRCKVKYIAGAVLLPLIYIGVPYIIYWLIFPGTLVKAIDIRFFVILVIGIPIGMLTAAGEEIGWRGFMVPSLFKKIGLEKTLLLSSLIWGVWHLPILISGLYMPGTPIYYKVPMFLLMILASGTIIGLLTLRSKSVWPAAVMHAAHNNFDQALFGAYTSGKDHMYYVSETGLLTVVIGLLVAVIYYSLVKNEIKKAG